MPVKPPFLRTQYNYDMQEASDETAINCKDVSLAKQSFAEECNINTIVKRFGLTGQLPENVRMPTYGDFSDVTNFHDAMNAIALANEAFEKMPADVRRRFDNDPGKFVDFCNDENNRPEAIKLGLIEPKPQIEPKPPVGGEVTPPAPAPAVPPATPQAS